MNFASVLVVALVDDGHHGSTARRRLRGEILAAPELIDLEVFPVLRRSVRAGTTTARRGSEALEDLIDLPLRLTSHRPLLERCWELRDNLTTHDACYVALAETLAVPLLTADSRLAHAPGLRCAVEILQVIIE